MLSVFDELQGSQFTYLYFHPLIHEVKAKQNRITYGSLSYFLSPSLYKSDFQNNKF